MKSAGIFAFLFAFGALIVAGPAGANAGIAPGSPVHIVKNDGNAFDGKLNDLTMKDQVYIYTTTNIGVRTFLKEIRRIADTGRKVTTDYGIYTTKSSNVTVYEVVKTDGSRFEGMLSSIPVFEIDLGTLGVQKNIWLNHLRSIEVAEPGGAPASSSQATITCPHCGKPISISAAPGK